MWQVIAVWSLLSFGVTRSHSAGPPPSIKKCYHVFSGLTRGQIDPFFDEFNDFLLERLTTSQEARLRQEVQNDLLRLGGKGYSILDTRALFPKRLAFALLRRLPRGNVYLSLSEKEKDWLFLRNGEPCEVPISMSQKRFIEINVDWTLKLLNEGLTSPERIRFAYAELRAMDLTDDGRRSLFPHSDPQYFTVLISMYGKGPVVRPSSGRVRQIGRGYTTILSGNERAEIFPEVEPTIHHSPLDRMDRLLLILRFQKAWHHNVKIPQELSEHHSRLNTSDL